MAETNGQPQVSGLVFSPANAKIAAAFVKAQSKIEGVTKGKTNPHFNSTYADLASVDDACRPILNEMGIGILQVPVPCDAGRLELTTTLLHESGEWMSGTGSMSLGRGDGPQAYGSALTYARRYFLAAMVGLCPEDDDGNGAEGQQPQQKRQPVKRGTKATADQVREMKGLLNRHIIPDETIQRWFSKAGVEAWDDMPSDAIAKTIEYTRKQPPIPAA